MTLALPGLADAEPEKQLWSAMGLLTGVTNHLERARATSLIVEMLTQCLQTIDGPRIDPFKLADRLMGDIWKIRADLLSGKSGQRPHKAAAACYALAFGLKAAESSVTPYVDLSLATVLRLAEENADGPWKFHELDFKLLQESQRILDAHELEKRQKQIAHWVREGEWPES